MNKKQKLAIKENFNSLKETIISNFTNEINLFSIEVLIELWNRFVEDEKEKNCYMFNFNNNSDLIELMENNNFNAHTICDIVLDYTNKHDINTSYFLYDADTLNVQLLSVDNIKNMILSNIDEIVTCMMCYPFVEVYKTFYVRFISDTILENNKQ